MLRNLFNKPKSVYFFTLHKSASTLFGNLVLGNTLGLTHIDYASKIYMGELKERPQFEKIGYIYGPIRVWREEGNPESQLLLEPCLRKKFLMDKKCLLFIRDPRDVLVSFYHSVAFTHSISADNQIARIQNQRRNEAIALGIEEFCMQTAPKILENYTAILQVQELSHESLLLRYEDLINDFLPFASKLSSFLKLTPEVIKQLFDQSRPLQVEDAMGHKRSGATGAFNTKLSSQTIKSINQCLSSVLQKFNYSE